ncbi:FKBP-type peptidyl-prolyl cis-trans isomerase [Sulfurimonas marina]|uniref:peptidylprolyl isomerase n=1 Tax=Sulfurimonas marina TaxID=2590551 RepID=A0A7M1AXJ6_9BACT|nr:peptidylprolyl isomerase [Sulfurimonas marina]QOP42154.1 peptidylprolyl isomerase [Sulfurimonas marina]
MEKITKNTLVSLSLKLEDEKGNLIDESDELMYLHGGYNQIFPKLEAELEGKKVGDTFELLLAPAEAFGEYDESLVAKESLQDLPEDVTVGMELEGENEAIAWVVESIEDEYAVLNANHELAGITLKASGEILEMEHLSDEGVDEILKMEHEH